MKIVIIILMSLIVSSCSDSGNPGPIQMIHTTTVDEIVEELRTLRIMKHKYKYNYEDMERNVRGKINEWSICKRLLKTLEDRNEKLSEQSWKECDTGDYSKTPIIYTPESEK